MHIKGIIGGLAAILLLALASTGWAAPAVLVYTGKVTSQGMTAANQAYSIQKTFNLIVDYDPAAGTMGAGGEAWVLATWTGGTEYYRLGAPGLLRDTNNLALYSFDPRSDAALPGSIFLQGKLSAIAIDGTTTKQRVPKTLAGRAISTVTGGTVSYENLALTLDAARTKTTNQAGLSAQEALIPLAISLGIDINIPPAASLASTTLLAKAQPDECYIRYSGNIYNNTGAPGLIPPPVPTPDTPQTGNVEYFCADPNYKPKTNESYIWGMARSGQKLWFGTGANVMCMVMSTYLDFGGGGNVNSMHLADGSRPNIDVCEFRDSWVVRPEASLDGPTDPGLPKVHDSLGDWRPPTIYQYDLAAASNNLTSKTALITDDAGKALLQRTLGLRSGGSIGDIVFLAGPDVPEYNEASPDTLMPNNNVNLFAFNSATGAYLGSHALQGYGNIRKWRVLYGQLYTAVALSADAAAADAAANGGTYRYGRVLKWVGTPTDPFRKNSDNKPFVEVGILPGGGAELSEYGTNRIAIATWPGGIEGATGGAITDPATVLTMLKPAGISISVPVPATGGLNPAAAASNFTEVFTFDQYDPDFARAFTYGGGALAYFDGWLVWGSMHVPGTAQQAVSLAYANNGLVTDSDTCREIVDPGYAADRQDTDATTYLKYCTGSTCGERSKNSTTVNVDCSNPDNPTPPSVTFAGREACITNEVLPYVSGSTMAQYNTCEGQRDAYHEASRDPAISIFRGRNLETSSPDIDVLYGYDTMPAFQFQCTLGSGCYLCQLTTGNSATACAIGLGQTGTWQDVANGLGAPVFGPAGFGDEDNNYTWEMGVVNNRLYVGTMDMGDGADLYSFVSARRPAVAESTDGLGNNFNYGFRTLLTEAPDTLYIGTANPYNLALDGTGDGVPDTDTTLGVSAGGSGVNLGGWELLKLQVQ